MTAKKRTTRTTSKSVASARVLSDDESTADERTVAALTQSEPADLRDITGGAAGVEGRLAMTRLGDEIIAAINRETLALRAGVPFDADNFRSTVLEQCVHPIGFNLASPEDAEQALLVVDGLPGFKAVASGLRVEVSRQ